MSSTSRCSPARKSRWRSRRSAWATSTSSTSGSSRRSQRDGRQVVTRWWRLVGWSPGEHVIESPAVRWRAPGGELRDAEGDPTRVVVASVLGDADESADIRDIKGPEAVPPARWPWLLAAALLGVAALGLLAARLLRARRRRRRRAAAPARARGRRGGAARAARPPAPGAGRVQGVLLERSRASCAATSRSASPCARPR